MEVDVATGVSTKYFKTYGKRDGDILTQKVNCCGVFTSKLSGLVVTICKSAMKTDLNGVVTITDIYGQPGADEVFNEE